MKTWLRRFAKLVGWLLLVLVLFLIEENVRGRILLSRYKHKLRAAGEKLTVAELGLTNPLPPPDPATIQLLAAAEKLGDWNPDNSSEARTLQFMRPVISGAATFSWQVPITELRYAKPKWVPNTWTAVAEELRKNEPTLSLAMDALRQSQESAGYGFLDSPVFAWEQRDKLRYWLMWATANNLRERNLDGAVETTLALARLGKAFQGVHGGYYRGFAEIGLDATWELLQSGATNDEQLSALQDIWSNGALVPLLAKQIEAYRAFNLERLESRHWLHFFSDNERRPADWLPLHGLSSIQVNLWFLVGKSFDEYAVLVLSQDYLDRLRAVAHAGRWNSWQAPPPPRRSLYLPWLIAMPYTWDELWRDHGHPLQRIFEFETQREMTVAAIALQRYRLRHNHWPDKLQELVPDLLPSLPRDWMDGQPLRYRRNANETFTLYSIGDDLRDDGGDPSPAFVGGMCDHPEPMWQARDAVWPCVATDENIAVLKRMTSAKKNRKPNKL